MFKFLRRFRRKPEHKCTEACTLSPCLVQAELRRVTDKPELAAFLDKAAHATLSRDLPVFHLISQLGPHLQWDSARLSLVKVHDDAHAMLDSMPHTAKLTSKGNVRAGGRAIAELIDGIIRREIITAAVDTHINRAAYFEIMLAQATMLRALQKLTTLNMDVPVPDVVDNDKAV